MKRQCDPTVRSAGLEKTDPIQPNRRCTRWPVTDLLFEIAQNARSVDVQYPLRYIGNNSTPGVKKLSAWRL